MTAPCLPTIANTGSSERVIGLGRRLEAHLRHDLPEPFGQPCRGHRDTISPCLAPAFRRGPPASMAHKVFGTSNARTT